MVERRAGMVDGSRGVGMGRFRTEKQGFAKGGKETKGQGNQNTWAN